jgi:hypothetical protein
LRYWGNEEMAMEIDDPKAAFEKQYMQDEQQLPKELATIVGKLALPDKGMALEILQRVAGALFDTVSARERVMAMWNLFVMEISHLETTKVSQEDVQQAIQLAFVYDRHERDDTKRERYVKLIGNALKSDTEVQEIATFVQTVGKLGERDVTVLKVLNTIMNKEGDWKPQPNPGIGDVMKAHPNVFRDRAQELAVNVAMALGQKTEKNMFSREEGYMVCTRLQGFGLAHEVEVAPRELPLSNYAFRLSVRGITLLKLLGENVPNLARYAK